MSTLERRFCSFLQCGVNRAARRALRPNLLIRLSVCVHVLMRVAPHAERPIRRPTALKTDGVKKNGIKTDGDISRLTVLDMSSCAERRGPHFATTYLSKRSRHLCLKWAREANWRQTQSPIAVQKEPLSSSGTLVCRRCGTLTFQESCLVVQGGASQTICQAN